MHTALVNKYSMKLVSSFHDIKLFSHDPKHVHIWQDQMKTTKMVITENQTDIYMLRQKVCILS